jgi:hypothetical protein
MLLFSDIESTTIQKRGNGIMKILALDKILDGATEEKIKHHLKNEALMAWDLYMKGTLRELYFRQDRPGAVLVMECESVVEARRILDGLPLAKEGLIAFDVIPLGPFVPFAALFS